MASLLMNVYSGEQWDGKVFLGFTHFAKNDILGSTDLKLSIKDAKKLIDQLVGAVNDIESREGK
jgi:hypothetical protein